MLLGVFRATVPVSFRLLRSWSRSISDQQARSRGRLEDVVHTLNPKGRAFFVRSCTDLLRDLFCTFARDVVITVRMARRRSQIRLEANEENGYGWTAD